MLQVYDDFIDGFDELKEYAKTCEFKDEVNPIDGVTYPYICKEIPESIKREIIENLNKFKGAEVENPVIFMRMSPKNVPVPHVAHTDISMGQYSLMLYINVDDTCATSFLRHIPTGIAYQPVLDGFVKIVQEDMNNVDAWAAYQRVFAKENRAAIFDAGCIHRAEPIGGCGEDQSDARIVLTCFFS